MEFIDGGDLKNYIKNQNGVAIPENKILIIFQQLLKAVYHLHTNRIIHRDIKPENVFYNGKHVKLGDLGIAK